jgi:hypothetical protein
MMVRTKAPTRKRREIPSTKLFSPKNKRRILFDLGKKEAVFQRIRETRKMALRVLTYVKNHFLLACSVSDIGRNTNYS